MSWADLVQTLSLVIVTITFAISVKQSREMARQSALAHNALGQGAQRIIVGQSTDYLATLMTGDPELLSWFLATRGIELASSEINRRRMLMFLRMDAHEATYLAYLDGALHKDVWEAWKRVIKLDALTPEFQTVWRVVAYTYSTRFVALMDELLSEPETVPVHVRTVQTAGICQ